MPQRRAVVPSGPSAGKRPLATEAPNWIEIIDATRSAIERVVSERTAREERDYHGAPRGGAATGESHGVGPVTQASRRQGRISTQWNRFSSRSPTDPR
jgi:hypothetical protein